jgi:hypothetical protein
MYLKHEYYKYKKQKHNKTPSIKLDLKAAVLDIDSKEVKIQASIEKPKAKIEGLIQKSKFDLKLKKNNKKDKLSS